MKDGKPIFTVGAAGGPKIITQVVWAIINHLDLQMPVPNSIAAPRLHHQWSPNRLLLEKPHPKSIVNALETMGHQVELTSVAGVTQAIGYDPKTGIFTGAHDPRVPGRAQGQ
jgi:gamma-glutamyltranspeptidase/glutathione hydrolase